MHITDIQNNSEPLTDFSGTEITRKLNGDYTLSFSILPTEQNKEAYNMIDKDNDALITCNNENFVVRALQVTRLLINAKRLTRTALCARKLFTIRG